MDLLPILLGLVGLLGGAGIGVAAAYIMLRSARRDAEADRQRAVSEAVTRVSSELSAELSTSLSAGLSAGLTADRDQTVQALVHQLTVEREQALQRTIDTVLSVAGDKLGSQSALASRELGLRSEVFEQRVAGMNDELRRVSDLVSQLQKEKAEQHGQLVQGINEAVRASAALSDTTQSLREALSNSRARGQWGERMAEDVLRSAGFIEGLNYRKQQTLAGGSRPDLTFLLPRDRVLHMDVKFPIDNYLRVVDAGTDAERDGYRRAFLKDVRARIKELTGREYIDPDTTVGYVLLFIPNESVYGFIHEHDPAILDHALGQQVVLCSPFSLFAVLGVVRQAVDNFLVERTSDEILECLGGFTKQWDLFSDKLDRLGNQFATAQKTYDELAGTRRRQLQKQLDHVDRLRTTRGLDELEGRDAKAVAPAELEIGVDVELDVELDVDLDVDLDVRVTADRDANDRDGDRTRDVDIEHDSVPAFRPAMVVGGPTGPSSSAPHPATNRRVPRLRPLR